MSTATRKAALKRLAELLKNPESRSIDGKPVVHCKDGRRIEVSKGLYGPGRSFCVSLDFGLTCRTLGYAKDLDGVLDIIIAEQN